MSASTESRTSNGSSHRHGTVFSLLMVIGLSLIAAGIARVESDDGSTPFLSANDRSRWQTVASLVHNLTYATDFAQQWRDPQSRRRTLQSIDRVQHVGADGAIHDYSSKPPLLPTLYAAVYWLFYQLTALNLYEDPLTAGRWMLVLLNLVPIACYWLYLKRIITAEAVTAYSRTLLLAAGMVGTLVLPFAITLSNHLPATVASLFALYGVLRVQTDPERWGNYVLAGLAAGFCAANELPALSIAGLWGLLLMRHSVSRAILGYGGGCVIVAIAFFATNWLAHQSLRPPYAHRGLGAKVADLEANDRGGANRLESLLSEADQEATIPRSKPLPESSEILRVTGATNIVRAVESRHAGQFQVVVAFENDDRAIYQLVRSPVGWELYVSDDWYDYPGTYWTHDEKTGVDLGEPSRAVYAFHATFGHHGLISLTPIFLLSIAGAWIWLTTGSLDRRLVAAAIVTATVVCFVFYLARPLQDRNYGGVSCCFRWMLWFTPLWLWLALPAADKLAKSRWQRGLGYLLLAIGVYSVMMAMRSPWQHPWIYQFWAHLGWIAY